MINPTSGMVERLFDVMAKRHQALSSNVANVDTPGYRATDFEVAPPGSSLAMASTHEKHLSSRETPGARRFEVQSEVKPNGNNVNFERELTELGKNAMQYLTLVQFLNQKIRTLRASINEGGRV